MKIIIPLNSESLEQPDRVLLKKLLGHTFHCNTYGSHSDKRPSLAFIGSDKDISALISPSLDSELFSWKATDMKLFLNYEKKTVSGRYYDCVPHIEAKILLLNATAYYLEQRFSGLTDVFHRNFILCLEGAQSTVIANWEWNGIASFHVQNFEMQIQ